MNEDERQLLAMLDASGFDFRSTTREISQRFPPELDFSGSSALALATLFLGRHQVRVTLANGDQTESLDSAAAKVGEALATSVVVEQYSNDG